MQDDIKCCAGRIGRSHKSERFISEGRKCRKAAKNSDEEEQSKLGSNDLPCIAQSTQDANREATCDVHQQRALRESCRSQNSVNETACAKPANGPQKSPCTNQKRMPNPTRAHNLSTLLKQSLKQNRRWPFLACSGPTPDRDPGEPCQAKTPADTQRGTRRLRFQGCCSVPTHPGVRRPPGQHARRVVHLQTPLSTSH